MYGKFIKQRAQDVVEGWDAADALAEGWDEEKTISFLRDSKPANEVFQNEEGRKRTDADTTARTGKIPFGEAGGRGWQIKWECGGSNDKRAV